VSGTLKLPPRVKVLEALSALADGRVRALGEGRCEVVSSDGSRIYTVVVKERYVYSNDNGTVHRGYIGYPIIACLMAEGRLPVDRELAEKLKGIPWRELNERLKKYDSVIRYVYASRKIDARRAEEYTSLVLRRLRSWGAVYHPALLLRNSEGRGEP
jgi:hypothetical protein